jgi:hypothetical protein
LTILLGETLLKDSMDPDPVLASCGVKGLFFYSVSSDLWEEYLKGWLTHPSSIIREASLVGLIDAVRRSRYGWEDDVRLRQSTPDEEGERNLFARIVPVIHLVESMLLDPGEEEGDRERRILSALSLELLELYPLLLWDQQTTGAIIEV